MTHEMGMSAADTSVEMARKDREYLAKKGIKGPDPSTLLPFKLDSKTTIYANSPERLAYLIKKHSSKQKTERPW